MISEKNIDAFDLSKLILSFLVITIHIPLLPNYLNPLSRIAVPLFFMMSSYFFFKKTLNSTKSNKICILKSFLSRNIKLYIFWFIVLLPITILLRDFFSNGIIIGLGRFIQCFLFYSTFRSSWYIPALCFSVSIVFFLSKKLSNRVLLASSFVFFIFFCLYSNYYGLIKCFPIMVKIGEIYENIFVTICNSFPFGFFWVVLGKMYAEKDIHLTYSISFFLLVFFLISLYCEQYLIIHFQLAKKTDVYFSLAPLCLAVFYIILNSKLKIKRAKQFRVISTITYVLHSSALVPIMLLLNKVNFLFGEIKNLLVFIIDVLLCIIVSLIIMKAEKIKCLHWLKWSH